MTINAQTAFENATKKQYEVVIEEIDRAIVDASTNGKFEVYFDEYSVATFIKVKRFDAKGNVVWTKLLSRDEYMKHVKDQQGLLPLDEEEEKAECVEHKSYAGTLLDCYHDLSTLTKYYENKGFSFKNFYGNHTDHSNDKAPRHILMISWG